MAEKQTTPSAKRARNGEGVLALWLLFFLLVAAVVITVTLARAFSDPVEGEIPTAPPESGTQADPKQALPVFSGGIIPTMPASGASTAVLSSELSSVYAILVDPTTGDVLCEKNPDTAFSPASMTKIMTLAVACERLTEKDLERRVTLTQEITDYVKTGSYEGASVSLIDGEKYLNDEFRLRDLLYGIGVESAADCTVMVVTAVCPAATVGESEAAFVALMNRKAEEMGLTRTHFDNVIGNDSLQNYTTAREMAVITAYAMQSNLIADILGKVSYSFQGYYEKDGETATYPRSFYSTLFRDRMETYKKYAGNGTKEFSPATAKLTAGKTGSFVTSSFLACEAVAKTGGKKYIAILGDAEKTVTMPASTLTLSDLLLMLDTYIK